MTTIREAAQELDITESAANVLRDDIADDPDLYNTETQEITDLGMEVIRTAFAENSDPMMADYLAEVEYHGNVYRQRRDEADEVLDEARGERDAAIRKAVAHGHNRTKVAELAGISRERLYQII
jgi:hypothetical protein